MYEFVCATDIRHGRICEYLNYGFPAVLQYIRGDVGISRSLVSFHRLIAALTSVGRMGGGVFGGISVNFHGWLSLK